MIAPSAADRIRPLADDAWLIELGDVADGGSIDDQTTMRVHALAAAIRIAAPRWVRDTVPAYASLGVFFDVELVGASDARDWLLHTWSQLAEAAPADDPACIVEVPVLYGGDAGPDLATAAAELGLTADDLARRHAAGIYRVAMIGFAPGFPYLSGLDPALSLPRLASPRTQVAAGSVAIGGAQTGIYPRESPGGWRLLGRTPLRLFDPLRDPPALLAPGDRVRFRAVDAATFARLQRHA